ncbi:MAG: glutathione S-transferase, partial [bacterium]|nr:glutathione S-transferase [bacterium]
FAAFGWDKAAARTRVKAFLDRIHARPAYQAALKRGGPQDHAS